MQHFNREERKYLVDPLQAVELVNYMHHYIPFQKRSDELITNNRSVYFDNASFVLFRESILSEDNHCKYRLRDYGYRGAFDKLFYAELKKKVAGISRKRRIVVPKRRFQEYREGRFILKKLKRYNTGADRDFNRFREVYRELYDFQQEGGYYPMLVVEYDRISFEVMLESKVRITLDRNVSYYNASSGFSYKTFAREREARHVASLPFCILETKLDDPLQPPRWLTEGLELFDLKQVSFSKYTAGIQHLLDNYNIVLADLPHVETAHSQVV